MSQSAYANGDRVRHVSRPEWGTGTIVKIEPLPMNGHTTQRLSIRFPNAGLKTMSAAHADLERIIVNSDPFADASGSTVEVWDQFNKSGWLAPMAQKKIEEVMISLPEEARDPFNSLAKRLSLTLALYRFDRSGRGLMNWAVAQTGMDDPLTRFTRHELEEKFDRWAIERGNHLSRLLVDADKDRAVLTEALKFAPPEAVEVVRRITADR